MTGDSHLVERTSGAISRPTRLGPLRDATTVRCGPPLPDPATPNAHIAFGMEPPQRRDRLTRYFRIKDAESPCRRAGTTSSRHAPSPRRFGPGQNIPGPLSKNPRDVRGAAYRVCLPLRRRRHEARRALPRGESSYSRVFLKTSGFDRHDLDATTCEFTEKEVRPSVVARPKSGCSDRPAV